MCVCTVTPLATLSLFAHKCANRGQDVNRSRLEKVQSFVSVGVNINTIACAQIKLLTTLCSKKGT